MAFWVMLLIWVGETILGILLRPRLPGSNQSAASPDVATARAGDPITAFWGRVLLAGNVTWWGDFHKSDAKENGQVVNTYYFLGMQQCLAWGPVDVVFDIWLDKTKRLSQIVGSKTYTEVTPVGAQDPITAYVPNVGYTSTIVPATDVPLPWINPLDGSPESYVKEFHIKALEAYGGVRRGGGVQGTVRFHSGYAGALPYGSSAPTDDYLDLWMNPGAFGGLQNNYPNLCYIAYEEVYFGTTANIKPWLWEVGRYPNNLGDAVKCKIVDDANPAEMIWEILTSQLWGVGMTAADLDMDSFQYARDVLYDEGAGMSLILSGKESADTTISDILRHIDGVLVEDPITGLIRLKLVRADYDGDTLVLISETNKTAKSVTMSRPQWRELLTDIFVNYTSREKGYGTGVAFFPNMALFTRQNERRSDTIDYKGFTTAHNVLRAGERALRTLTTPLARGQITCEGVGRVIAVGDVFLLTWSKYGFDKLPVRATKVNYGSDITDPVLIDYIEDIFGQESVIYQPPNGDGWHDPRGNTLTPTVTVFRTETETTGQVELAVQDPSDAVQKVEFRVTVGSGTPSAWAQVVEPYIKAIVKDMALSTKIAWKVSYTAPNGTTQTIEDYQMFGPNALRPPKLNPIVDQVTGDTNYAGVVDPVIVLLKFAYSKTGYPTVADARVGTSLTTPFTGTVLQTDSTLAEGETLYFTTVGYDAASNETEPSNEKASWIPIPVVLPVLLTTFDIVFEFGDGQTAPTVNAIAGGWSIDFPYTITGWTIDADVSGSAVVDIQTATFANPPVWASIAGTDKPTLASQTGVQDTALTGWGTTAIVAGKLIRAVLSSLTTCKKVTVTLKCVRS